jgi:hypothetical protein
LTIGGRGRLFLGLTENKRQEMSEAREPLWSMHYHEDDNLKKYERLLSIRKIKRSYEQLAPDRETDHSRGHAKTSKRPKSARHSLHNDTTEVTKRAHIQLKRRQQTLRAQLSVGVK